jgi:hypothetical protein
MVDGSHANQRLAEAIRRFDEENARDPRSETWAGTAHPRELLYAKRLSEWVSKLCPNASEELRLAARCQHLCRWMIPRDSYEQNRAGYHRWRNELKRFHAERSGAILREVGYPETVVSRVQALNLKQDFPQDPESCVLEDALCLVFLQFQLAELAARTEDEKVINAIAKSWKKMTAKGREAALRLDFGPRERGLIKEALKRVDQRRA